MALSAHIVKAKQDVSNARRVLEEAEGHLHFVLLQDIRQRYGVTIGSRVRTSHGGKQREYTVTGINTSWYDGKEKPWVAGQLHKKGGDRSVRNTRLYQSWELVTEEEEA